MKTVRSLLILAGLLGAQLAHAQSPLVGTGMRVVPQSSAPPAFTPGQCSGAPTVKCVGLWSLSSGANANLPLWRMADGSDLVLGAGSAVLYSTVNLPFPVPPAGTLAFDTTTHQLAVSDGTLWWETSVAVAPTPTIASFTGSPGNPGDSITITGAKFAGITAVSVNSTPMASYTVNSSTSISCTLPAGFTTGPISVVNPVATATGSNFTRAAPTISGIVQTSGVAGDSVVFTGTNFYDVSAVDFNGASASFTRNSGTQITATVPVAASTGAVHVVTPGGTATGPTFTVSGLLVDLTSVSLPATVTASRTGGTIFAARSASTAASVASGDVAENRGDETCTSCVAGSGNVGMGHWTWPTWTQDIATPNTIASNVSWTFAGSGIGVVNADGVAPDGTTTAVRITDSSATDNVQIYRGATGQNVASIWVKDYTSAPTITGGLNLLSSGFADVSFGSPSSTWRRLSKQGLSGTFGMIPAGFTTSGSTVSATGGVWVWVPSVVSGLGGYQDLPSSDGTATGALTLQLAAGALSQIVQNGKVDIEGYYELDAGDVFSTAGSGNPVVYVFIMATPQGAFSLRQQGGAGGPTFTFAAKGADLLTATLGGLFGPSELHWRVVYDPNAGVAYLQIGRNGAGHQPTSGVAAAGAIGTPTSFYLGSNAGASILPRKHTYQLRNGVQADINGQEIVFIGDSIVADYAVSQALTGTFALASSAIYTTAQSRTRAGIASLAHAGDTIAQQKTAWDASVYKGKSTVKAVVIHIGANNLIANTGETSAAIVAEIQALVNDVKGANPTAKIIVEYIYPFKQYLDAINVALWPQVAVVNTGISALTSVDNVITSTYAALDDGNFAGTVGYIRAAANTGIADHIHTNYFARTTIQGPAYLAALQAVGVLP